MADPARIDLKFSAAELVRVHLLAVRDECLPAFRIDATAEQLVEALRAAAARARAAAHVETLGVAPANPLDDARRALVNLSELVAGEPVVELTRVPMLLEAAAAALNRLVDALVDEGRPRELEHKRAVLAASIAMRLLAKHRVPELITACERADTVGALADPTLWQTKSGAMLADKRLLETAMPLCALARAIAAGFGTRSAANNTRPTSTHTRAER